MSNNTNLLTTLLKDRDKLWILLDESAKVVKCSDKIIEIFKCKNSDELIQYFYNMFPVKQADGTFSAIKFEENLASAKKSSEICFDWQFTDINGGVINTNITLYSLHNRGIDTGTNAVFAVMVNKVNEVDLKVQSLVDMNNMLVSIIEALPMCLNIWDINANNIMCNSQVIKLFGVDNKQTYLDEFFRLSPEIQPDGKKSSEAANNYIMQCFKTGFVKFMWLHCDINGKDVPCEITLVKVDFKDSEGNEIVAGYTRDLSSEVAGNYNEEWLDYYFLDSIPEKKLFRTISELSDEWFYAVDVRTSNMQFFGKGRENFGLTDEKYKFPDVMLNNKIIYEEDIDVLKKLEENMKNGINEPIDIRLVTGSGNPHYFRLVYQTILDKKGNPVFSIGKAFDINEQKSLEILSKTDLLTNCYNKITAETLIADAITEQNDSNHAMFIVDIDNFKAINDNLGHHFGDLVLSEISAKLRKYFRNADIIGRIGGDEFIVFLKNVNDLEVIEDKAKKISKAFQNTYSGENNDYKISGSIGIALYPKHGATYEMMYKSADKALYQSKLKGKNCYTFYSPKFLDGTMKNKTTLENASRIANSYFDTELVSTVFNLMYETQEINSSLNAVMQFIGNRSNSDRCYIFESFDNGKTYSNTYEWCAEGIEPEIDNLQGLTHDVLIDFFKNADEKGIFYSNDLRLLKADGAYDLMNDQGIKSFLHAQIREKGVVKLFLGLDDCTRTRVWSEKEINSILYAAKMISIFLLSGKRHGYSTSSGYIEV